MKKISPLILLALISASCSQMSVGGRNVASEKYINYERVPFVAGSAYFSSADFYKTGEQIPLTYEQGKKIVLSRLEEICQKSVSRSMNKDSFEFSYQDRKDIGGDFGDVLLHPVLASTSKVIRFDGKARCETDETYDQVISALKENKIQIEKEENPNGYVNLYAFNYSVATMKMRVFKVLPDKTKVQLSGDELPEVKFTYGWQGPFIASKKKEVALKTQVVEVIPEGDVYMKVDLKPAKENLSSWHTNTGIRAYAGNKTVSNLFIGVNNQTGAMVLDIYLK